MLEIKNISVRLKGERNYIVKNLSLYVEGGKIVANDSIDQKVKELLFGFATNQEDYEIKIGSILFDGIKIKKKIITEDLEKKILASIQELQTPKEEGSISKYVCSEVFQSQNNFINARNQIISNKEKECIKKGLYTEKLLNQAKAKSYNNDIIVLDNSESSFEDSDIKVVCHPLNNYGFTLVELLATISILAVLALMAVPNVVGVTQRNKQKTYVEDAKKMISLAEYKVNADPNKYKPSSIADSDAICMPLSSLGATSFATGNGEAPNGGQYDTQRSYVRITKKVNEEFSANGSLISSSVVFNYSVQLAELKDNKYFGVQKVNKEKLYSDSISNLVKNNLSHNDFLPCVGLSVSSGSGSDLGGNIGGSENTPNYGDLPDSGELVTAPILSISSDTEFGSNAISENYIDYYVNNKCIKNPGEVGYLVYKLQGSGVSDYSTCGGNINVTIGSSISLTPAILESSNSSASYYTVKVPLVCNNSNFAGGIGGIWLHVPAGILWKDRTNWTGGNLAQDMLIGNKTVQYTLN